MPYKAIISDWNGTLFECPTDEVQNKKIAYAVLHDAKRNLLKGNFRKITDIVRLVQTKRELRKRLKQYHQGMRHLWEVYTPFNEKVLQGRALGIITAVIDRYAKKSVHNVDGRVIRPIQAAHRKGKYTAILSVSFDYSIKGILKEAGCLDVFDDIVSNTLLTEKDKIVGLTLDIYQKKPEVLRREFFDKKGLREKDTLYLGDSEDDAPVAELLEPGNFIVPFFASDEFKGVMASKYKSFVPEGEEDLMRYLKEV